MSKSSSERYSEWKAAQISAGRKQRQVWATDEEWTYMRKALGRYRQLELDSSKSRSQKEIRARAGCWNPSARNCDCPACGGYND